MDKWSKRLFYRTIRPNYTRYRPYCPLEIRILHFTLKTFMNFTQTDETKTRIRTGWCTCTCMHELIGISAQSAHVHQNAQINLNYYLLAVWLCLLCSKLEFRPNKTFKKIKIEISWECRTYLRVDSCSNLSKFGYLEWRSTNCRLGLCVLLINSKTKTKKSVSRAQLTCHNESSNEEYDRE